MGLIIKNGVIYNGAESEPVVYSLDEREVGVWIDGKPLYERTFDFSSEVVVNQGNWANTSIDGTGIDSIVDVVCRSGKTTFGMLGARNNNNVVQLFSPMAVGVYGTTIRYTKTTDTPGSGTWTPSGAKSEHYSTNEHVVGTWIDGSTMYEKTIVVDSGFSESMTVNHGISNIDKIIGVDGVMETSYPAWLPLTDNVPVTGYNITVTGYNRTSFDVYIGSSRVSEVVAIYITIHYTKTTS